MSLHSRKKRVVVVHVGALPGWQQLILDPDKRQPNAGTTLWLFPTAVAFEKNGISAETFGAGSRRARRAAARPGAVDPQPCPGSAIVACGRTPDTCASRPSP